MPLVDTDVIKTQDVWGSCQYIGYREDFFDLAKRLVKTMTHLADNKTESELSTKLSKSKIYIIGDVRGERYQVVLFVYVDTPTYFQLENNNHDILTNVNLQNKT